MSEVVQVRLLAQADEAFMAWFAEKSNQDDSYGRKIYPLMEGWQAGVRWVLSQERGAEGTES